MNTQTKSIAERTAAENAACCCGGPAGPKRFRAAAVDGYISAGGRQIPVISSRWRWSDLVGAIGVRLDINRMDYAVAPGLYALGAPDASSPVIATANYKLTFDIVRRTCRGLNLWVLALDTKGINVWCAAGKGTFGTMELARRIGDENLAGVVSHRTVIVPQLGAPGVAAHVVADFSGFTVQYGPVRIEDLARYLADGRKASPAMRRVTFTTRERLLASLLELALAARLGIVASLASLGFSWILSDTMPGLPAVTAGLAGMLWATVFAGTVVFSILLPVMPFTSFSLGGGLLGAAVSLGWLKWSGIALVSFHALSLVVLMSVVAGYLAFNFTGNSTYTSISGVRRELRYALPAFTAGIAVAVLLQVIGGLL